MLVVAYARKCDRGRRIAQEFVASEYVPGIIFAARRIIESEGFDGTMVGFITALGEMAIEDSRDRF